MLKQFARVCVLGLMVTAPAGADDLTVAATDLCEKVKSCAMSQLNQQELTPQMREMMQPMLDNMCADMQGKMGEVEDGHPLHDEALACMRSLEKLSCDQMMNPDQMHTPECDEYEKQLGESGNLP